MTTGRALPWHKGVYASLDFETTGVNPKEDRIVSVGFVITTAALYAQQGSWHAVVDPGVDIPKAASDVHGYTNEKIAAMEKAGELKHTYHVLDRLLDNLRAVSEFGWPLVIFNAPYDWTMLHVTLEREGYEYNELLGLGNVKIVDPLVMDRHLVKFRKGRGARKLAALCKTYSVFMPKNAAHDAFFDCLGASMVARRIVENNTRLRDCTLDHLQTCQGGWHTEWAANYERYRQKTNPNFKVSRTWPIESNPQS